MTMDRVGESPDTVAPFQHRRALGGDGGYHPIEVLILDVAL